MENIKNDLYIDFLHHIASQLSAKVYLVGGAVRDLLLKKEINDYDFVVFGDLEKIVKKFTSNFFCKGVKYNKKLTTYRIFCQLKTIDLSKPRGKTLEEDLKKRDFTINSIALDLDTLEFIDPTGGIKDIERGIVRSNSEESIKDDPLRILRGFRLAASFRFDLDSCTIKLFKDNVDLLKSISKERVAEELKLFFNLNETFTYILIMDKVGVIDTLFEDLSLTNGCIQSTNHLFDVKTHSLSVYNFIEWAYNRLQKILERTYAKYIPHYVANKNTLLTSLKLAALFHDAGKPFSKTVINGKIKFPYHENESAKLFDKYSRIYPFGKKITKLTKFFIEKHIEPSNLYKPWSLGDLDNLNKAEFFLKYAENGLDLLFFALADTLAKGKIRASKRHVYVMFLSEMAHYYYFYFQPRSRKQPLITGKDIIKLYPNIDRKKLKPILFNLRKLQIADTIKSKEEAISVLKRMV